MARQQPALFARLIDLLTEAVTAISSAQVEAGAEALQLFDSWAGVLPRAGAAPLVRRADAPDRHRAARAASDGADHRLSARGRRRLCGVRRAEVPVQGISLDTTVPVGWAAQTLRREPALCLQGNLDPVALLADDGDACSRRPARSSRPTASGRSSSISGHGVIAGDTARGGRPAR